MFISDRTTFVNKLMTLLQVIFSSLKNIKEKKICALFGNVI